MYLSTGGVIGLVTGFLVTALIFGLIGFFIGLEQAEVIYEQLCHVDKFFASLGYLVAGTVVVGGGLYLYIKGRRW